VRPVVVREKQENAAERRDEEDEREKGHCCKTFSRELGFLHYLINKLVNIEELI